MNRAVVIQGPYVAAFSPGPWGEPVWGRSAGERTRGWPDPVPGRISAWHPTHPAPAWVSSLPTWGTYNATRAARLFWTAMEPTVGATIPQYVLYLHNSLRRCKAGFSEPGCSGTLSQLLPFNSYSPVITNNAYSELLSLTLPAGTYTAQWVKPENNTNLAGSPFNLVINANGSCTGSPNPPCKITSQNYSYDIALKLTKQ